LPCNRSLLPCNRSLLPCNRSLLPCNRSLLPCSNIACFVFYLMPLLYMMHFGMDQYVHAPSDTIHLGLPGGAAGAMDSPFVSGCVCTSVR